ncbi:LacI family DNA-binding transcriptional regulator [Microbacterium paludicola]|uniref:LacI family DNA-binding transcriptional regulator n=1 Tax=Microbacterium paludicola TaxID=300019 RepID=UPI0011A7B004|nr:LacI family DNA-binding transcriptional regulator [Microbacterium paludicola]
MNSKRVTMRDVAAEAGVAPMTVSYTYTRPTRVAAATRDRVLAAAARLGYAGPDPVARSLRNGATRNLGVILGERLNYAFEDPQAARFLAGVSQVCVDNRLGLVLIPSTGNSDDVERVREAAVDGFVLWTTDAADPVLDAVIVTGRPAAIQGGPDVDGIQIVAADDREAARAVAGHMLAGAVSPLILSHPFDRERWTGLTRGPSAGVAFPVTRDRLAGFRDAVEQSGGDWAETPVAVAARNTREDGRRTIEAALSGLDADEQPDVVIAMSDQLAAGARDALGASVRISGWDDSETAQVLGFSSIRQSLYDQGVACASIAAGLTATVAVPAWSLVRRG